MENKEEQQRIAEENKKTIQKLFKLPIEYSKKIKTTKSMLTDLELIKTVNKDNVPIYNILFSPKTDLAHICIDSWSKYYTNDIQFLKDSQNILKNINDIPFEKDTIEDTYKSWNEIRNYAFFKEKFQYIEWDKILFLNKSPSFLMFLSFLNVSSPLMQLLAPVLMLIIPFLALKIIGTRITIETYIEMLKKVLKNNNVVQMITNFSNVSMNQKMYILMTVGLYFYNLYQNFVSCRQFYRNAYYIIEKMNTIKNYLEYTINKIKVFSTRINTYETYGPFLNDLCEYEIKLTRLYEYFKYMPKKCTSFSTLKCFGNIMRDFYNIYDEEEWNNTMMYSFGFNGYIDNLIGLRENIVTNKINSVEFTKRNKFKFYDTYHPSLLDKPTKNNIDLKKSIILTGPNAAGKTTMLKSTIINLLFSQQFGYGYYRKGVLNPYDFIHCYINIPDDCSRDSLFQSEVRRCKTFLDIIKDNPESRHFCVFDELFSGTNPYEAISSAYAYLNHIVKNKKIRFLLTTHFIRLCELFRKNKKIKNFNMNTNIVDDKANYTYKMIKGISTTKGGISVLKDLKYPDIILDDARNILTGL